MNALQDAFTHLPQPLQDSWVPWNPYWDDQAAAPRDGDGWKALLPSAELEIDLIQTRNSTWIYTLHIWHTHTGEEITYAESQNLLELSNYAE